MNKHNIHINTEYQLNADSQSICKCISCDEI